MRKGCASPHVATLIWLASAFWSVDFAQTILVQIGSAGKFEGTANVAMVYTHASAMQPPSNGADYGAEPLEKVPTMVPSNSPPGGTVRTSLHRQNPTAKRTGAAVNGDPVWR
jgi:hypothetical protein